LANIPHHKGGVNAAMQSLERVYQKK